MLTNKQKNIIIKKYKHLSSKKIAILMNVDIDEVESFIKSIPQKKTPKWFVFVLFLLPFFLLFLLELTLRISNYGKDYSEWINLDSKYEILNPEIANKYFHGITNVPFSTESFLLRQKPENSFRIIVLGASSGAGYPYQNAGSFTKYLRKSFQYALTNKKVEISNISMAAINSHTILDILPSVISKHPDQIIIYLGHNEYYGALGAGSMQSFSRSRSITKLMLTLKEFKIFQLTENIIEYLSSLLKNNKATKNKTLMSKMAKEEIIKYKSQEYYDGIEQFKGNLNEILSICKNNDVPVLVGTLTSNLKDLKPFVSYETKDKYSSDSIFNEANREYQKGNFVKSDSLFRLSKDLDGLRFRAPEDFNKIIIESTEKFNCQLVNIDSIINGNSINGIVGDELMTDHLHPNKHGYQLMGKLYFQSILSSNFPQEFKSINLDSIDNTVKANYHFTKYDSLISDYRIKILKNDWPFQKKPQIINKEKLLSPKTIEGTTAFDVLEGKTSRFDARLNLINYYQTNRKYNLLVDELLAFVETFPTEKNFLNKKADELIKLSQYSYVDKLLYQSYYMEPDVFNTKWLGILNVSNNNIDKALKFLEMSYNFNNNDPQVLFNISGIYLQKRNFSLAKQYIDKCLKASPNYKNAINVKSKIEFLLKQNN